VAYGIAFAVNSALVSAAIGLAKGMPILSVWRENNLGTIGVDLLASPLVFVFAWVYANFGVFVAATSWIPILGLRQVHKTNLELEQTNQELLELMVKSIEARDPYTSGHSRRVQHYSTLIARAMGLPERDVARISQAALLHDVGKIHEKYGPILGKAEHLNPEEWAMMQEHPIDGANLVATMTRLKDLVDPIKHHHENWDGTGYPLGLAGEHIPLAARIIRFADTIDAMVTQRPYRHALGADEVRAEVVRCRGSQFDPSIADQVLSAGTWGLLFAPRPGGSTTLQTARRSNLRVMGA
jgi:putative nucleotidyltransferase with HDIG domain